MKQKCTAILCLLLAACMLLGLCSCGAADTAAEPAAEETAAEAPAETEEAPAEEEPADETEADGSETTDEAAGAEEAAGTDYSTGSPWVNSNILSNVEKCFADADLKDNFDLAVNGQWVLDNPIESGRSGKDCLTSFEPELNSRLTGILTDDSLAGDHNADLVQTFYTAFLDWDARDAAGVEPLLPYLTEIEAIDSMDAFDAYASSTDVTLASLFSFFVDANPGDSSSRIFYITRPSLFLDDPADYGALDSMDEYTQLTYDCSKARVQTVLSACGWSDSDIDAIFAGSIELERQIAGYCYTQAERNLTETDAVINSQVFTAEDLSDCHWFGLLSDMAAGFGLDLTQVLLYNKMDLFEHLDEILCEDNLELIRDYLLAHTASAAIDMLGRDAYYSYLDIRNTLRGSEGYEEEAEYALTAVEDSLGWPLSRLYCDEYVTAEDKQAIYDVITDIVAGYEEMLAGETFLSEETREKAIYKLQNICINCMYPDDWTPYDYSGLELSGSYFDMVMQISAFETRRTFEKASQPVTRGEWFDTPITLNAYYNDLDNSVTILPGLVGNVLYSSDMSKEEIYAGVGMIVGHEISHAFDPNGACYDADGNYVSWWTDEDYENFDALTDRLVAYYDSITVWDGFTCDGELVKTEACADMGGVAVLLHLAESDPDFDYDAFFRAYAHSWAQTITPNYAYYCGTYDEHPLLYLRVNATVQQFEAFYETYGITEGDGMYLAPEDRVAIW